jgi:hypothetical protein
MTDILSAASPLALLKPGTRVEVRRRFDQSWTRGFEVAEVQASTYRLRRCSDGAVLPYDFDLRDVRAEHKKPGLWWY